MTFSQGLAFGSAARLVGDYEACLSRVLHHLVEASSESGYFSVDARSAIDETAAQRGHAYILLFVHIYGACIILGADGSTTDTLGAFATGLKARYRAPEAVEAVCIDMNLHRDGGAILRMVGVAKKKTNAEIGNFHAVKLVNDAVDKVRHTEAKTRPGLKRIRFLWRKNAANRSADQPARWMVQPVEDRPCLLNAARLRADVRRTLPCQRRTDLDRCRLDPMKVVPKTKQSHRASVLRWLHSLIANSVIKGIYNVVPAVSSTSNYPREIAGSLK